MDASQYITTCILPADARAVRHERSRADARTDKATATVTLNVFTKSIILKGFEFDYDSKRPLGHILCPGHNLCSLPFLIFMFTAITVTIKREYSFILCVGSSVMKVRLFF